MLLDSDVRSDQSRRAISRQLVTHHRLNSSCRSVICSISQKEHFFLLLAGYIIQLVKLIILIKIYFFYHN